MEGFPEDIHCSIKAKLYQFQLRTVLAVFLPKFKAIAKCRAEL